MKRRMTNEHTQIRDHRSVAHRHGLYGFSHGYGEIPARDYSIQAIRRAHAFGCTFFDTAESYGPNLLPENRGHNEHIVGEAIHGHRGFVEQQGSSMANWNRK